jgi:hypothetical protein
VAGNDGNTIVLLHFDGADASTTMTDVAYGGAHTWTAAGNAQLDTAQSKFGGASLLCDGTGDYITTADSNNFTPAGDFTADCWFRIAGGSGRRWMFGNVNAAGSSYSFLVEVTAANFLRCLVNHSGGLVDIVGGTTLSTGVWYHCALVKNGTNVTLYLNGGSQGSATSSGTLTNAAASFSIGRGGDFTTLTWNGHIDEFRFSHAARWTAPFTPPVAAYDEFVNATLSAAGVSTVAWVGPNSFNMVGTSVGSFVGVGSISTVLNASALATPNFMGAATFRAALSAQGQAASALIAAADYRSILSSQGISTNSFVSAAEKAALLESAGSGLMEFQTVSYLFSFGSASVNIKGNAPGNAEIFFEGTSEALFEGRSLGSCSFTIEASTEIVLIGDYNRFIEDDPIDGNWSEEDGGSNGWVEEGAGGGDWL